MTKPEVSPNQTGHTIATAAVNLLLSDLGYCPDEVRGVTFYLFGLVKVEHYYRRIDVIEFEELPVGTSWHWRWRPWRIHVDDVDLTFRYVPGLDRG